MRTSVKYFAFAEGTKNMDLKKKKSATNDCVSRNRRLDVRTRSLPTSGRTFTQIQSCNTPGHAWSEGDEGAGEARSVSDALSVEFYGLGTRQGVTK